MVFLEFLAMKRERLGKLTTARLLLLSINANHSGDVKPSHSLQVITKRIVQAGIMTSRSRMEPV